MNLLKEYKNEQDRRKRILGRKYCDLGLVFDSQKSSWDVMHPDYVKTIFKRIEEKYNLNFHLAPHRFRHTCATLLYDSGWTMKEVAPLSRKKPS